MASYDAIINLRLKGLDQLKEVERAVNGITGKTRTGRARTGASSIVKKELSAEQERLKTLGQIIKLKRIELGLNRQAGNTARFMDRQRTGVGPNNLLALPSSKNLKGRGIKRLGENVRDRQGEFTASSIEKAEFFEKRRNEAIAKGIAGNNKLIGLERIRNAQLIKTNTAVQKAGENLIRLSDSFGKLSVSAGNLLPQTRTSSGKMLALPSSEMLDQRVRGSGQFGGFSRALRGKSFRQRIGATRGFDMQSALISGAFPLLFGQGPVGALAGGLGGGIGGMFGQMGGFAGGIAATALVQQIQQVIGKLGDLGKAMSPFVQDTNALINSMGLAGTAEAKRIQIIEQLQGKQAAFNAAMQKMKETIGTEATKNLQQFGEKASLVGSEFKIAMTKMQAALIPLIDAVDKFLGVSKGAAKAQRERFIENSKNPSIVSRREELAGIRANKNARGNVKDPKREAQLEKELEQIANIGIALENQRVKMSEITLEHDKLVQKTQEEKDLKEAIKRLTETGLSEAVAKEVAQREQVRDKVLEGLDGLRDSLNIQRAQLTNEEEDRKTLDKIDKLLADILDKRKQITDETNKATKAIKDQGDAIKKVKITKEEIADLLANEMTNALMGLIEGTKSLGESLASIAKSLAKMFLNAAFQNIFNNLFQVKGEQGLYNRAGGFKAFQYGGVVNSPTLGMIGEGGEPEYVIPASKMSGAMSRYSAGARGGAVIPGGSGNSGTVAGGSGNTIVEYTGPVLNFNGDEYVPKTAVPEIINTAAKQGASAGRSQAFATLKNSRSQRATLGL